MVIHKCIFSEAAGGFSEANNTEYNASLIVYKLKTLTYVNNYEIIWMAIH